MMKKNLILMAGFAGLMLTQGLCGSGAAVYQGYKQDLETAEQAIQKALTAFSALSPADKGGAAGNTLISEMNQNVRKIEAIKAEPILSVDALKQSYRGKAYNQTLEGFGKNPTLIEWLTDIDRRRKEPRTTVGSFANIVKQVQDAAGIAKIAYKDVGAAAATVPFKDNIDKMAPIVLGSTAPIAPEYYARFITDTASALQNSATELKKVLGDDFVKTHPIDDSIKSAVQQWQAQKSGKVRAEGKIDDYKKALTDILKDLQVYVDDPALGKDVVQTSINYYKKDLTSKGLLP